MNEVSLFTGYGGMTLGLRLAGAQIHTVLYCEINPYRQSIIRRRVKDGFLDDAPIWPDVRTLNGRAFSGKVGVLTASFPCQPHSVAGKRKGASDSRNLWPDTARLVGEIQPSIVFLENVPGIAFPTGGREPYALTVLGDLARLGYDARWGIVGARDVGAPHRRDRWWCLAHAHEWSRRGTPWEKDIERRAETPCGDSQLVAHARPSYNGGSPALDDTDSVAWWPRIAKGTTRQGWEKHLQPTRQEGSISTTRSGVEMGDADSTGREREGYSEQAGHLFPFPPGPADTDAWARVLVRDPGFAPALSEEEAESLVRGVADGAATGVGGRQKSPRRQQLQALGDGVVPQAAAMAFLRLEGKLAE